MRMDWLWDRLAFLSVTMQNSPPFLHFNILAFFFLCPCIYVFRDNLAENFGLSAFEEIKMLNKEIILLHGTK